MTILPWHPSSTSHTELSVGIIYQSPKFFFSCVSLVESVSRETEGIRLSQSHQRAREIMHYSPVNKKNHVRHHENT